MTDSVYEYKVSFRTVDLQWAADHEGLFHYDPTPCCNLSWDDLPWNEILTYSIHKDEEQASAQYQVLVEWEQERSQPIKDVSISKRKLNEWEP